MATLPSGWSLPTGGLATDPSGQHWRQLADGGWFSTDRNVVAQKNPWEIDFGVLDQFGPGQTSVHSFEDFSRMHGALGYAPDKIQNMWDEQQRKRLAFDSSFEGMFDAGLPGFLAAAAGFAIPGFGPWNMAKDMFGAGSGALSSGVGIDSGSFADAAGNLYNPSAESLVGTASGASGFVGNLPTAFDGSQLFNSPYATPGITPSGSMTTPSWMGDQTFWTNTSGTGGVMDWLKSLFPGAAGGGAGMPWSPLTSLLSIASGAIGMGQAGKIADAGRAAAAAGDPFGPYRAGSAEMLFSLMADPSKIEDVPGYRSGLRARQRALAGQGFNPGVARDGSAIVPGQWSYSMDRYGGDFYQQEINRLMQMAGVGIAPQNSNAILTGQIGSSAMTGQALQSLIAGLRGLVGG